MAARRIVIAICLLLVCASLAEAQGDIGTPTAEAIWPINQFVSFNLGSGNLLITGNIRSKDGPIPVHATFSQNVQVYAAGGAYKTVTSFSDTPDVGPWAGAISASRTQTHVDCGGGVFTNEWLISGVSGANGTFHALPPNTLWDSQGCLHPGGVDVYTTDNTGLEVNVVPGDDTGGPGSHATVYSKGGMASFRGQTVTDTHGNQLTFASVGGVQSFTDELTSTPVFSWSHTGTPFPTQTIYQYADGTGATRSVTANNPAHNFLPVFTCAGITATAFNINPLTSVSYPDGSAVNFTYETTPAGNYNGRLKTVQVPTGGTYTFSYSGGTNGDGQWCTPTFSLATMSVTNGSGTWTFARSSDGTTTTVTDPDGSKIVYTFAAGKQILTSKVTYDTNGTTVLDTMTYCYDSTIAACNSTPPTNHPTWIRAYHTVPGVTGNAETDTQFDTYGNVVEVDRFDFGPTLVSKTLTTFGNWNGSACVSLTSAHIVGAPCDVQVQNASSQVVAHSRFNYDNTTGDLLTSQVFEDATNFFVTTNSYNTNGTLASVVGPTGIPVNYGNSQCNGFLQDHSTTPIGTNSMTWDCNGAKALTTTALNGLVTTNTYGDSLYRTTQISDNSGMPALTNSYTSLTQSSAQIVDTGFTVKRITNLDTLGRVKSVQTPALTNYDTTSYTYDTSGRVLTVSQRCNTTLNGTCSTPAHTYAYDGMGRIKTDTVHSAVGTDAVFTTTYPNGDVLTILSPAPAGENTKQVRKEYDGLGRLVAVCTGTASLSGSGSCGMRSSGSGYLVKMTLDSLGRATQTIVNAQVASPRQTYSASYDFLSRILTKTSPMSGTRTFYYDATGPDCGSYPTSWAGGLLTETKDNAGNVTCIVRESGAARVANVYYPSGPNAAASKAKFYVYDSVYPGLGTGANLVGHLSAAGTCTTNTSCATARQIEAFGYDELGRVTDTWQKYTGGNNRTFHVTATTFSHGMLKTVAIPSAGTITYGLDAVGRPKTGTLGATGYVSNVAYDSSNRATNITYNNGDSTAYTYDPVLGPSGFTFTIGSPAKTATESMTFNANGTRATSAITSTIDSGNNNSCTMAHDDLAQITSHSCTGNSNLVVTATFDPFGNATRSGTYAWAPGYDQTNNHEQNGATYDSNGRMLHDVALTRDYTWDTPGNMATVSGIAEVYDAFDRLVFDGGNNHIIYGPTGKLGKINDSDGVTSNGLFVELPGGETLNWKQAGNVFEHRDADGDVRMTEAASTRTGTGRYVWGPFGEGLFLNVGYDQEWHGMRNYEVFPSLFGDSVVPTRVGRSIVPPYAPNNSPY